MRMNCTHVGAALIAFLGCEAVLRSPAALADVDVDLANGDTFVGTIDSAADAETLRVFLPKGAKLSVTAAGDRGATTAAGGTTFSLRDSGGNDAAAGKVRVSKKGATLRGFTAPADGEYRVVLTAATAGDYRVNVSWKSPKRATASVTTGAAEVVVPFAADPGTVADFTVAPARGSAARPRLNAVTGESGAFREDLPRPFPEIASHSAAGVQLAGGGAYALTIGERGTPGPATVSIALRAPKPLKRIVAATTAMIDGDGDGTGTLRGFVAGAGGGAFSLDASVDATLAGAGISIPSGALVGGSAIVIGAAPAIPDGPTGGLTPAGPTVFFGPAGTTFAAPVLVTIPMSVAALRADASLVRVVERAADGTLRIVDPTTYTFDPVAGTISFPATHFTAFRAFVAAAGVRGDVDGDGFADVIVVSERVGTGIHVLRGGPSFASGTEAGARVAVSGEDYFGWECHAADVNADGRDDLVFASPFVYPPDSLTFGRLWVKFGGPSLATTFDAATADVIVEPAYTDASLGESLATADVTGDTTQDIVIGVGTYGSRSGSVFVFAGGPGIAGGTTNDAAAELHGLLDSDAFGESVATGDVTGDGRADLVVGAPGIDRVYVFAGPLSAGDTPTASAYAVLATDQPLDQFGNDVAAADVNGDGVLDVIVGAPRWDSPTTNVGRTCVFLGGPSLKTATVATAFAAIRGTASNQNSPRELLAADLDADGDAEIVIGQRTTGGGGTVYVFRGGASITATTLTAADFVMNDATSSNSFGDRLTAVDADADGFTDLCVTAPGSDVPVSNAGAVRIFRGGSPLALPANAALSSFLFTGAQASGFWGAR